MVGVVWLAGGLESCVGGRWGRTEWGNRYDTCCSPHLETQLFEAPRRTRERASAAAKNKDWSLMQHIAIYGPYLPPLRGILLDPPPSSTTPLPLVLWEGAWYISGGGARHVLANFVGVLGLCRRRPDQSGCGHPPQRICNNSEANVCRLAVAGSLSYFFLTSDFLSVCLFVCLSLCLSPFLFLFLFQRPDKTDPPTNHPTDGHGGSLGSYTSTNIFLFHPSGSKIDKFVSLKV